MSKPAGKAAVQLLPGPKRILVMRYRFIGDTLLTVPFLRNLRRACPDAEIDVLVGPHSGELLENCPYVNNLIFYDTTRKHRYENPESGGKKPRRFWSYVSELRNRHYDTAFVLKRSFSSALLAFLAGIPRRVGFDTEGRGLLLTHRVPYRQDRHEARCFLDTLEAVNFPAKDDHMEAWWPESAENRAAELIAPDEGRYNILVHLTSSNRKKEWPEAAGCELIRWLLRERPDATLHVFGADGDKRVYESILSRLSREEADRVKVWCGMLSLQESMALIHRMRLAVGVDSGTLHMAAAAGVPVVALFAYGILKAMNPVKWQPPGAAIVQVPSAADKTISQAAVTESIEQVKATCRTVWTH